MAFCYRAYGLSISSGIELPELTRVWPPVDEPGEVVVEVGAAVEPEAIAAWQDAFRLDREAAHFAWPDVGRFQVRGGGQVLVEPCAGVAQSRVRASLLGPVLATVLFQRGFLVLHASAVTLPDADGRQGAVAFLGGSGAGKSTLAAALHARGHSVVADDFVAIPTAQARSEAGAWPPAPGPLKTPEPPLIFPGYAQLRLWPESLEALGEDAQALPLLFPEQERRVRRVRHSLSARRLPLRALCVLEEGAEVSIEPLPPARAVVELSRYCYCSGLLSPADSATQFRQCGALAAALPMPIRRLQRPRDLRQLDRAARVVEEEQGRAAFSSARCSLS